MRISSRFYNQLHIINDPPVFIVPGNAGAGGSFIGIPRRVCLTRRIMRDGCSGPRRGSYVNLAWWHWGVATNKAPSSSERRLMEDPVLLHTSYGKRAKPFRYPCQAETRWTIHKFSENIETKEQQNVGLEKIDEVKSTSLHFASAPKLPPKALRRRRRRPLLGSAT